jgi:ABC-type transport system substrate-binding protein
MFQVESLAAPDDTTFVVTLNQVNWQYWRGIPINALTWIASPASIEAAGENFGNAANVAGAGPFEVTARTPGAEI